MLVCISQPIRKTAVNLDLSSLTKIPGFIKNPIPALTKYIVNFMRKSPENEKAVLDYLQKSPDVKEAAKAVIPILIISALLYLASVIGKGVGESLEKHLEKAMDKELGRQTEIKRVIDTK